MNWTDNYGKAALHYAVKNDNIEVVRYLYSLGANIFNRDNKNRVSDICLFTNLETY